MKKIIRRLMNWGWVQVRSIIEDVRAVLITVVVAALLAWVAIYLGALEAFIK